MSVCLDSWAVIAWLRDEGPAAERVSSVIDSRPVISWVNLVEVYYRTERNHGRDRADEDLRELRIKLKPYIPDAELMIEAARLKAANPIALGDCFALATAAAHGLPLWTGDPEIIELTDPPCEVVDLRASSDA